MLLGLTRQLGIDKVLSMGGLVIMEIPIIFKIMLVIWLFHKAFGD